MVERRAIPSGVKKTRLLLGTIVLLAIAFIVLIGLFIILAELLPSFTGKCVAVVDINVPLTVEGSPTTLLEAGYPDSEQLAKAIERLDERADVGSVLLVVNSGGGSVVATHEVYDAVSGLEKPSVSYFREYAASGAYYVATGTDYIVSDPAALTGSIGVKSVTFLMMTGLMEKLGVNATTVTSGDYKDIGSPFREMTEDEKAIMQSIVDEIFDEFKEVVIKNRGSKLDRTKFDDITDGRVLTGRQALDIGLVDALGTKDDALLKAAELGGIEAETAEDVRVCYVEVIPQQTGLFSAESFIGSLQEKLGLPSVRYQ